ncbi:MAG: ParB/RepB/Spo0J family partition protein [Eubacteriaceae bacterium]
MEKKKSLGRGLRALIPEEVFVPTPEGDLEVDADKLVFYVKTNNVRPNPDQPRKHFDKGKLEELSISIKEHGIIQPLVVTVEGKGYTIIAGERRWRAATMAGLKEIPVLVKDLPPDKVLEIAIIENVQRENLSDIEEALAYEALMENFNMTQGEIGIRIGKSRTAITNTLRLLKLPQSIQDEISRGNLSSGHARAILGLDDPNEMEKFAQEIMDRGLSVREAEKRVKKIQLDEILEPLRAKHPDISGYTTEIEDGLRNIFHTKTKITNKGKKGKIELYYESLEELDRILELMGLTKKI